MTRTKTPPGQWPPAMAPGALEGIGKPQPPQHTPEPLATPEAIREEARRLGKAMWAAEEVRAYCSWCFGALRVPGVGDDHACGPGMGHDHQCVISALFRAAIDRCPCGACGGK